MSDTPQEREHWWPPSWIVVTTFLVITLSIVAGVMAAYTITDARRDARNNCERSVAFRDDTRAMWIELFEAFPESPAVPDLYATLNERLPELHCDGNAPLPISTS